MNLRVILFCLLTSALCLRASAQSYSIDWYKVAGGGGTSTGGVFSATGTIGQPDAGENMSGGSFSVTSGFWSLISVVQSAGSPTMTVSHLGNTVKVSWPSSSGFVLQQNSNLATTNWTTSGFTIFDDGTNKSITITSPSGNLFFRLKQ